MTDDYIYSNFGRVTIGYDEFEVDHSEEKPKYTVQKVLSDFGGLIGIYLGASFISMAELLAAGAYVLFGLLKKAKEKSTVNLRRLSNVNIKQIKVGPCVQEAQAAVISKENNTVI